MNKYISFPAIVWCIFFSQISVVKSRTMTDSRKQDLPHFVAINRIMKLPVVLSGVNKVTYIYVKVKVYYSYSILMCIDFSWTIFNDKQFVTLRTQTSNRIIGYSLESAEKTVLSVVDMSVPLAIKFEDPINKIDDIMCKSLDVVEYNVPMVTYTPEEVSAVKTCYIYIIIYNNSFFLAIRKK